MEIVSLTAFVLRRIKYSETSLIATLFSEGSGKISIIAKGARSPRSKSGTSAVLEPFNLIEATVYIKDARDVQILSKAGTVRDFVGIKSDLDRMEAASEVIRAIDSNTHANEPNAELWKLLGKTLDRLEQCSIEELQSAVLVFKARMLTVLGYAPIVDRCAICNGRLGEKAYFSTQMGGTICPDCGRTGAMLRHEEIDSLQRLFASDDESPEPIIPKGIIKSVTNIIRRHGEYYTDRKMGR